MDTERSEENEEDQGAEDIPKLVATVAYEVSRLVIRVGWPCLMMRRRARKCSKRMRKEMVSNGMPPELAAGLAEDFVGEIPIRKFIQSMDIPGFKVRWEDDNQR